MPTFLTPDLEAPHYPFRLAAAGRPQPLADKVLTTFDSASRRTRLLRHESMPSNAVISIAPCRSIQTLGMQFAIDVGFVVKDGRVCHAVPPWQVPQTPRVFATIEFASGGLEAAGIVVGDIVELRH
jgi:hypothetical protein